MYKCIKSFAINTVDDNGFTLDDEQFVIPVGSLWDLPEESEYRFIGGEVRLESDEYGWIEMPEDDLKERFEIVQ